MNESASADGVPASAVSTNARGLNQQTSAAEPAMALVRRKSLREGLYMVPPVDLYTVPLVNLYTTHRPGGKPSNRSDISSACCSSTASMDSNMRLVVGS
jgi:hypothetical protein